MQPLMRAADIQTIIIILLYIHLHAILTSMISNSMDYTHKQLLLLQGVHLQEELGDLARLVEV